MNGHATVNGQHPLALAIRVNSLHDSDKDNDDNPPQQDTN